LPALPNPGIPSVPRRSATSGIMPLFFFHIVHGADRQDDTTGVDLPGDQSAFDHAVDVLQRLLETSAGRRLNPATYSLEVGDAYGFVLSRSRWTCPFSSRAMKAAALASRLESVFPRVSQTVLTTY
jgi:hypothetical protein